MKRIGKILVFFAVMSLLTACPDSWYDHYLITEIRLTPVKIHYFKDKNGVFKTYVSTDSFSENMIFIMNRKTEIVANLLKDFSLVHNCYAFTRGLKWDNKLLKDSYELYFDHDITFDKNRIAAGENLLESILKDKITIVYEHNRFDDIIIFDEKTIDKIEFDSKRFKAYFKCKTANNNELIAETEVEIGY